MLNELLTARRVVIGLNVPELSSVISLPHDPFLVWQRGEVVLAWVGLCIR